MQHGAEAFVLMRFVVRRSTGSCAWNFSAGQSLCSRARNWTEDGVVSQNCSYPSHSGNPAHLHQLGRDGSTIAIARSGSTVVLRPR